MAVVTTFPASPTSGMPARSLASSMTLTAADRVVFVDASAGPVTITLPSPASASGKEYIVAKVDASANAVTVMGAINGGTSMTITTQYQTRRPYSDGTRYVLI